jgi:hypothetical protein
VQPQPVVQPQPQMAAPAPAPTPAVQTPCPSCSKELTWVQQYNRWYCYACGKYA